MKNPKITLLYLLLVSGLFISSCKDRDPTIGEVLVVDKNNSPVSGATVRIYCSTGSTKTCDVECSGTTDSNGITSCEFKLPAVLKIEAKKGVLFGEGYIKLEEHETVQQTVVIL